MSTTTYQIRIDDETKRESFEVFRALWMTPADGIRVFLRRVARTQSIPFPVSVPNAVTREAMEDTDKGIGLHRAKDAEDLFRHLGI